MWHELVCPADRGTLVHHGGWLSCSRCGRGFPVLREIPTFLPEHDADSWRCRLQYDAMSLAAGGSRCASRVARCRARYLEQRFPWLSRSQPRILRIGLCGEGEIHHLRGAERYAIDPLAGAAADAQQLRWGRIQWVQGRGEELPFRDGFFSLIVVAGALLRCESPHRLLAEAARCLHANGLLCLFLPPLLPAWPPRQPPGGPAPGTWSTHGAGPLWRFTYHQLADLLYALSLRLLARDRLVEPSAAVPHGRSVEDRDQRVRSDAAQRGSRLWCLRRAAAIAAAPAARRVAAAASARRRPAARADTPPAAAPRGEIRS
jgi:SAM-dependent methyltransferase